MKSVKKELLNENQSNSFDKSHEPQNRVTQGNCALGTVLEPLDPKAIVLAQMALQLSVYFICYAICLLWDKQVVSYPKIVPIAVLCQLRFQARSY